MTATAPELKLQMLGTFGIWREEQRLPAFRTRKEVWLLGHLLVRHPQPVERAWLAGMLWPDSDEAQALYNLRRSLLNLRTVLGPDAFRLTAPIPHTLALDLVGVQVDMLVFDAAIRRSEPACLREAVEIYRGPLLEGCTEAWVVGERMQREQAYLCALEALAEEAMHRQQPAEAAARLRQALNVDPLRENAVQNLLRCLAALGDVPGALETYRDFRLLLNRDLRAEPDAQTRLLYQQIREGKGTGSLSMAPAAIPNRPMPSAHLPHPLTELIGREAAIDSICRDVQSARLVTLTGPGGIGKTRLVIAAAAQCARGFGDGVWFVDLTAVEDPAQVAQAVVQTRSLQEDSQRTSLETLQHALRTQEMLLVLDNCEHLIAACAELAHTLLNACPHLRILATSRQSLGLAGERVRRIPPLSLPPLPAVLPEVAALDPIQQQAEEYAQIKTSAAARLFVERATAVNSEFELTPRNASSVAQICHSLEGVPYALELAAAWVKALDVVQIAARLRDPLSLPRSASAPGGSHRQTLRAMLAWSYSLLSASEQELLQRLSVFIGGWSLEAAEEVCGDVLDALTRLVDKSLVVYDNREGAKRYRLLETTRVFARELLPDADRNVVADRHAAYFRRCVAAMRIDCYGGRNVPKWQRWRQTEHANCLAAIARMQEQDGEEALALRLDLHYTGFLSYHTPEVRAWIAALYADPNLPRTPLYADLHCRLGQYALWIGENAIGCVLLERAVSGAEACGTGSVLAFAAYQLGIEERRMERFEKAQQHLEKAIHHYAQDADPLQAAICRDLLSELVYLQGDREEARRLVELNRRVGQERQDESILAQAAWRQAWLERRGNNPEGTIHFLKEFLTLIRRSETLPLHSELQRAASLAYFVGAYDFALPLLEEALRICQGDGDRPGEGWAMDTLARIALAQGAWRRAEEYACQSLRLFHSLGERGSTSAGLARLGEIYSQQGQGIREVTLLAHIEASLEKSPLLHTPDFIRTLHSRAAVQKEILAPQLFDAAWQSGWNMTLDQAVAFALQPTA